MSAPAMALPSSVKQEDINQDVSQQDIANLAYALWQKRGAPEGSPQKDWIEAERRLQVERTVNLERR